ncbi:ABC-type glycerol-3-phosphate transport system permease component [Pseudomonas psychrotolerans]|nr:ABC-type glycerol-3-phosphate transport system permease component [Pseudomonas psychrotolerans]
MIENRRALTLFSHLMLILGIGVILFPLYVAVVAATLDDRAVFAAPMTLVPGRHLWDNLSLIWTQGVGNNTAPFWRLLLNSFLMALGITLGKLSVSILSAFAIVWFRFPLRTLAFWLIFITLMLPVGGPHLSHRRHHRPTGDDEQLRRPDPAADGLGHRHLPVPPVLPDPAR